MNEGEIIAGKYRVLRALGEGGMGHVVLAEHVHLGERVAIKRLRPGTVGHGTASTRFLREARAAAKLRGEHIARATDFGVLEDGTAYLVLEYLDGEDLAQVLKRQSRVVTPVAVGYLLQACEGLAEAHAEGLVHRDIKPANLFLTHRPDGTPLLKVLDFGVAKRIEPDLGGETSGLTGTGAMMGSPIYMSPEQLSSSKDVGPTADVWGLSVVLYELLTGKQPFGGETFPAIAGAILYVPSPDPCAVRQAIPRGLGDVVLKGLAKKPEDRFRSVGELARALAPFADDEASVHASRASRILRETEDGRPSLPAVESTARSTAARSLDGPPGPASPSTEPSTYAPSPLATSAASTTGGISSAGLAPAQSMPASPSSGTSTLPMIFGGLVLLLALGGLGFVASRMRSAGKPQESAGVERVSPTNVFPTVTPPSATEGPARESSVPSAAPSETPTAFPSPSAAATLRPKQVVAPKSTSSSKAPTPTPSAPAPKVDPCAVLTITDPKTGEIRVKPGCR